MKQGAATAWAAGAVALVSCTTAHAQAVVSGPSDALRCLTPPPSQRTPADYPALRFQRKEGAHFDVELTFRAPDRPPAVRVAQDHRGDHLRPEPEFVEEVERYASQLRVPCLPSGAQAVIRQTFQFVPNEGRRVTYGEPEDADRQGRAALEACIVHQRPGSRPAYPERDLKLDIQGTVVAQARFVRPDAPPEVEILARPPLSTLDRPIRRWLEGLRLPCLGEQPYSTTHFFTFLIQDGRRVLFNDMTLPDLVGWMTSYPAPAFFDTQAMGCPFELRLTYYAPFARNRVGQIGEPLAARGPLLQWLSKVELDLPERRANLVLGESFNLTVPCTKLDIRD